MTLCNSSILERIARRLGNPILACWLAAVVGFVPATAAASVRPEEKLPNILVLLADDLGYEALGCYGGKDFKTPNLDRMAADGVRFARAYASPACTPTRVSFHTGRYPTEHGQTSTLPVHLGKDAAVDFKAMPTFAQLLRQRGYRTSTTGKWQLATLTHHPGHIEAAGFDSWCVWQIWDGTAKTTRYWRPCFNRDGKRLEGIADCFGPDVLAEYVFERMASASAADQPFLIVHNMLLPHEPIIETPLDRRLGRAASLGNMIEYLDDLVGRTLGKIEELGIRENTYVFFLGDNGTEARHHNPRRTTAGEVHGGKRDLTDAGTHIPLLVWGPDGIRSGQVLDDLIDITDFFPTICELARADIPATLPCRGISFVPQLHGEPGLARKWVRHAFRKGEAVSDDEWRLDNSGVLRDCRELPAEPVVESGEEASSARKKLAPLLNVVAGQEGKAESVVSTDGPASLRGLHYYRPMESRQEKEVGCEVAVYGGTPAGVTAAIEAARMGRRAVLVSFNGHVGGLTSGGLTATDIGDRESIGGLADEFYQKIGVIKDFSPAKAESVFRAMLEEAGVELILNAPLDSVEMEEGRIVSATMLGGETIRAEVFVDASYEGDLMAAAGVSYHVGREPRGTYQESLAGQWQQVSWKGVYQFCGLPISPYVEADDPASGLLPGISSDLAGKPGDGDYRIQAYNFRMFLSNRPGKIGFPKPKDYDPERYALLARFLNFDPSPRWTLNYTTRPMTDGPVQMRNGDSNNAGSFSSDHVDGAHCWPDGTYEAKNFSKLPPPRRGLPMPMRELYQLRETIFQDHVSYQLGLLHFLAHDPQVPVELQKRVRKFGLDPDEFTRTGHWPHQLYVREGRRMLSDYVMTQANCERERVAEDSIGLASYPMDSHFCQRVAVEIDGKITVRNEGGFGHPCRNGAYPIAYRSVVPKRAECANLLVPVALSASHVAFGSIRMEPVFMILGQSAGAAASLAIDHRQAVQDVDYAKLEARLLAAGQEL